MSYNPEAIRGITQYAGIIPEGARRNLESQQRTFQIGLRSRNASLPWGMRGTDYGKGYVAFVQDGQQVALTALFGPGSNDQHIVRTDEVQRLEKKSG